MDLNQITQLMPMIKRIDLFMPPKHLYQVLQEFTIQLAEAFEHSGVNCRILEAAYDNPKAFLETLLKDPPQCTLSFNGLLPDEQDRFFCDMVRIPHIACLVNSPHHFIALTHSNFSIITAVDRFFCDFLQGKNFKNVLFMPHGVDINLVSKPIEYNDSNRPIDVLMPASFIDCEAIETYWKNHFPVELNEALLEAAEITLRDRETPYFQAFAQALDKQIKNGLDPHKIDIMKALDQLEDYINGKDRIELVKAIKDSKVHLYGQGSHKWKKLLRDQPNIVYHDSVTYNESLALMKQSKIVLNSRAVVKNGTTERVLAGLASGALVLTNDNLFMRENFKHGKDILYYKPFEWDKVNVLINDYLQDAKKRFELVKSAREIILNGHTWDHRAAALISELPNILSAIKIE